MIWENVLLVLFVSENFVYVCKSVEAACTGTNKGKDRVQAVHFRFNTEPAPF